MPAQSNAYTSQIIQDQTTNLEGGTERTRPGGVEHLANGLMHSSNNPNEKSYNGGISKPLERMGNGPYRGQIGQSPPESPISTSSSMKSEIMRPGQTMPRNSSIDSAISNVSSTTNNPSKAPTPVSPATSTEIRNLIATAGSPENLIAYLLNEKKHAASQNAQLWKLVEKQRSLLLGLNKDLEQMNKDKEKYKRKVKELQTHAPLVPKVPAPNDSDSSAPGDSFDYGLQVRNRSDEVSHNDDEQATRTAEKSLTTEQRSSPMDATMLPTPLHNLQQQRTVNVSSSDQSTPRASETRDSTHHTIMQGHPDNPSSANPPGGATSHQGGNPGTSPVDIPQLSRRGAELEGLQTSLRAPAVTIIEPSPMVEKSEKSFSSTKRTKPAPLILNQSKRGSVMILPSFQPDNQSDSEYEDQPDTGEDRGRRKTREEDDQERALAAQQESEARSRSKRAKSAQADQTPSVTETVLTVPKAPTNGLPMSPRLTMPRPTLSDPGDQLPPPYAAGSTSQDVSQDDSKISQRYLVAPVLSPGLPQSPRPVDRPLGSPRPRLPKDNPGDPISLPLSPRMMPPGMPLSPRAPRQPLPPHIPSNSVPAATPLPTSSMATADSVGQPNTASARRELKNATTSPTSPDMAPQVFRGYVDLNYPNLLLPPNALPSVLVKIASPRLRPSRMSYMSLKPQEDAPVFMLSVHSRHDGRELWRAEKVILALVQLDHQFQAVCRTAARLPDRKLFSGHSPATIDARRTALDTYFSDLLDTPMIEKAALIICSFLSTDVIEPGSGERNLAAAPTNAGSTLSTGPDGRPRKEGFLTKRGKNFGGWKERFFVLHGPDLRYFESPGGAHLGSIKLQNAQIGKQSSSDSPAQSGDEAEGQYRHAFLILEPKRKDSTSLVRHVLCAESDRDRDEWVTTLLHYVDDLSEDESSAKGHTARADNEKSRTARLEAKVKQYASSMTGSAKDDTVSDNAGTDSLKSINYAETAHAATPLKRTGAMDQPNGTPSPTSTSSATTPHSMNNSENDNQPGFVSKNISNPTNGGVIQDAEAWGNKPAASSSFKDNYHKKRGLWTFRQKSSSDLSAQEQAHAEVTANQGQQVASTERQNPVRAVFGLPLAEAVELCPPSDGDINLPAVVYRCLEYLREKNAANEEGIFRLSGSNLVIKALKERFNTEGDVDLVADGQYYDVHAVASLFKLYLRELPTTVLTRELHIEFMRVLDLNGKKEKIAAFNTLVHRLPPPNFWLLRALSQYLLEVVNNSEKNKMSMRNVGIVFAPTLNIPAPVFAQFLSDFDAVFDSGVTPEGQVRRVEVNMPTSLAPVDIRSPRHQMFSDLPTPAYSRTSFAKGPPLSSFPTQSTAASQRAESPEDVGFTPLQPSYEARQHSSNAHGLSHGQQLYTVMQQPPASSQPEYGSLNMMMTPENAPTLKAKRRESSMLFLG